MSIDALITGGRIVDGTGNPWRYGDIAIQGERIADITPPGQIPPEQARERVDARGMVVCPGFIDIQSHSILPLMRDGRSLSKITPTTRSISTTAPARSKRCTKSARR